MPLQLEDPRLTNYVLGELSADEMSAIEQEAASDPSLRQKIQQLRSIHLKLRENLTTPAEKLQPRQRENVRRKVRATDRTRKAISLPALRENLQAWVIPASAAVVLAVTTFLLMRMPADDSPTSAQGTAAPKSASTTIAKSMIAPSPPVAPEPVPAGVVQRGTITPADYPALDLPVQTKPSSLEDIAKSIRQNRQRPPREAVHLEEILNHFSFRLNGVVAIAREAVNGWHPDNRGNGTGHRLATLSCEMIACPWKPSATLLLVSIRGNAIRDCSAKLTYRPNPDNVSYYRLLGYNPTQGQVVGALPTLLRANTATTVAIEIEAIKPGGDLGMLDWTTDDTAAPSITLNFRRDAEPSDDSRFAALVCTFAQWLAGELPDAIDAEIISALARESFSAALPPDRREFLELIDQSLHL